ncbi:MAG: AAA family ATPase, partial [Planctomycetota bacterium]
MRRLIETELAVWKDSPGRKPLIVRGARQVGKTWSLKRMGEEHFDELVTVNLERNRRAHEVFSGNLDAPTVLAGLEAVAGRRIIPGRTLLFLDEIQ